MHRFKFDFLSLGNIYGNKRSRLQNRVLIERKNLLLLPAMRRLLAFIFLFAFLFSGTEMHELLKVPHLLTHFIEHSSNSHNISLADFIKEHYNDNQKENSDHHKDKGCLPFQGKEHVNPMTNLMLNSTTEIIFFTPLACESKKVIFNDNLVTSFNGSIWLPPKIG